MKRIVNRARAAMRPQEPQDLNFLLDDDFIDANQFLIADLRGECYRYIVFGTEEQLVDLAASTSWFIEGVYYA